MAKSTARAAIRVPVERQQGRTAADGKGASRAFDHEKNKKPSCREAIRQRITELEHGYALIDD